MSNEHLVMALLAEGNPATEVAPGAPMGVPAATYLATLEQRSSDMTKTDQPMATKSPGPGRGLAWALATFAVIVTVAGLYLAFSGADGQVVDQTTVPTPTTVQTSAPNPTLLQLDETIRPLDPGVYFVDEDADPSTTKGMTFVIEGSGWTAGYEGVTKQTELSPEEYISLHVHPIDLRFGPHSPGCDQGAQNAAAGSTAAGLADAFASGGFTVLEAPAPVSAFGHDGFHVFIEVPEGCEDAVGGQYNIFLNQGDVMEAWLFDMDGQIVMVEANWNTETSEEDLAELRAVVDSLVLNP